MLRLGRVRVPTQRLDRICLSFQGGAGELSRIVIVLMGCCERILFDYKFWLDHAGAENQQTPQILPPRWHCAQLSMGIIASCIVGVFSCIGDCLVGIIGAIADCLECIVSGALISPLGGNTVSDGKLETLQLSSGVLPESWIVYVTASVAGAWFSIISNLY
jgi:hypothetical protein